MRARGRTITRQVGRTAMLLAAGLVVGAGPAAAATTPDCGDAAWLAADWSATPPAVDARDDATEDLTAVKHLKVVYAYPSDVGEPVAGEPVS